MSGRKVSRILPGLLAVAILVALAVAFASFWAVAALGAPLIAGGLSNLRRHHQARQASDVHGFLLSLPSPLEMADLLLLALGVFLTFLGMIFLYMYLAAYA